MNVCMYVCTHPSVVDRRQQQEEGVSPKRGPAKKWAGPEAEGGRLLAGRRREQPGAQPVPAAARTSPGPGCDGWCL